MPFSSDFNDCLLRRILARWAACFTLDPALQMQLVEKTIEETLRNFPSEDDDTAIDTELFSTMRRIALQEFSVRRRQKNRYMTFTGTMIKNGQIKHILGS
jgi:DNA-directed RNA polymerase specialized sigma24 family protein